MGSRWMMAATAACASLLLAACVPGLSDDAGLYFGRNDGSVPMAERQTVEVYISDTAPRYAGIIEDVAREAGGVLGTDGDSRYGGCTTQDDADVDIAWEALYVALIDYEDLRRIVWEGAQRNGFAYSATPDYSGKYNSRSVAVGDEDGNLVIFTHIEGRGFVNIGFYGSSHFGVWGWCSKRPGDCGQCRGTTTEHRSSPRAPHQPKLARNSGTRTLCSTPKTLQFQRCDFNV